MRILLINKFHYFKRGAERAYFDMAKILTEHGHEVAFFSTQSPDNEKTRWSKYFVSCIDYKHEKEMSFWQKTKAVLNIWYNFEAARKLQKLINEFKPDIAHMHNIYHQLSPSIINVLKKNRIPMAMTLHDYKLINPSYSMIVKGKIWEKTKHGKYCICVKDKCVEDSYLKSLVCTIEAYLHKFLKTYEKVDIYISPSQFLINKFEEFGFAKRLAYLPNPVIVDEKDLAVKPNKKFTPYMFYLGYLIDAKGLDLAIKALKTIKNGLQFVVAGTGPEKENLEALIKQTGLKDRVHLVGFKQGKELWSLLKGSQFAVLPARWYENAPYNIAEANYFGKPVISADLGGQAEMVKDGYNGYLFKPNSHFDLARAIKLMVKDEKKTQEMGKNAKNMVLAKHDKEVFYRGLMNIYNKIRQK